MPWGLPRPLQLPTYSERFFCKFYKWSWRQVVVLPLNVIASPLHSISTGVVSVIDLAVKLSRVPVYCIILTCVEQINAKLPFNRRQTKRERIFALVTLILTLN